MGAKIKGVFRWGKRYAKYAATVVTAIGIGIFRRIRRARYVAMVVIGLALAMYAAPYLVDALQCVNENEADQALKCLDKIYDRARRDTNLAAIIIALAVTLAAWRPERYQTRRRRARANANANAQIRTRARRRRLRNADTPP